MGPSCNLQCFWKAGGGYRPGRGPSFRPHPQSLLFQSWLDGFRPTGTGRPDRRKGSSAVVGIDDSQTFCQVGDPDQHVRKGCMNSGSGTTQCGEPVSRASVVVPHTIIIAHHQHLAPSCAALDGLDSLPTNQSNCIRASSENCDSHESLSASLRGPSPSQEPPCKLKKEHRHGPGDEILP